MVERTELDENCRRSRYLAGDQEIMWSMSLASRSDAPFLLDYAPIYAVKSVHYAADYALNLQICSDYALQNFDERKKTAIFPGVEILDHTAG